MLLIKRTDMKFKEFKEGVISKLQKKIVIALETKKQSIAKHMFSEETELEEGMEAFKAAAEVLKQFGGKMPKGPADLEKFDSEIEKASKKYKVSVDEIIKVITK